MPQNRKEIKKIALFVPILALVVPFWTFYCHFKFL